LREGKEAESKIFHIGDILSVTTSILVSPRYMDGLYELLRYLTGEEPAFESVPDVSARCRPYLVTQYPLLDQVDTDGITFENWQEWLGDQKFLYGEWLRIERPQAGEISIS